MMVVFKLITLNMKVGLLAIKNMYFFIPQGKKLSNQQLNIVRVDLMITQYKQPKTGNLFIKKKPFDGFYIKKRMKQRAFAVF